MARKKAEAVLSFEQALEDLEKIVQKMESSELKLEESVELFTQGIELASFCNGKLTQVQQQIQKVVEDSQGNLLLQPLNIEEE